MAHRNIHIFKIDLLGGLAFFTENGYANRSAHSSWTTKKPHGIPYGHWINPC